MVISIHGWSPMLYFTFSTKEMELNVVTRQVKKIESCKSTDRSIFLSVALLDGFFSEWDSSCRPYGLSGHFFLFARKILMTGMDVCIDSCERSKGDQYWPCGQELSGV